METTESKACRLAYELEYAAKYPNVRMAGDHEMLKSAAAELKRLWQLAYVGTPSAQWVGLTDEEIEKGRDQTFSINNPYCPCDSKTMRKAVRWAEAKLKEKNT